MERADSHPRRFTLERFAAEDLPTTEASAVLLHLEGCDACKALDRALRADLLAFRDEVPYAAFRVEHERRREARGARPWSRRIFLGLGALAAAAAALLVVVTDGGDELGGTRIKGNGVALSFAVQRGGALEPGVPGEALPAGTIIQLSYDAGSHTHLAIVGLDAAGAVSIYLPESGDTLVPLPAGPRGRLPFSLTLDEGAGAERFVALFADSPRPLAEVTAATRAVAGADPAGIERLPLGEAYAQASVWIRRP